MVGICPIAASSYLLYSAFELRLMKTTSPLLLPLKQQIKRLQQFKPGAGIWRLGICIFKTNYKTK